MLLVSAALVLAQFVPAYLGLDLVFRTMDLRPDGLRRRLAQYRLAFATGCGVVSVLGAWAQWRLAGPGGMAMAAMNWVPWWLLWRFGLRKQLTFLFRDDGGSAKQPDLK